MRFLFVWLERLGYVEQNPFKHIKNLNEIQHIIKATDYDRLIGISVTTKEGD